MNQKSDYPYIAAELIYISPRDGAQQYEDTDHNIYWLEGKQKVKDIKVGDKGYLHFENGCYIFKKESS